MLKDPFNMKIALCLLYLNTIVRNCLYAASNGAKKSACADMYPLHATTQQEAAAPYKIALSSNVYYSSANISVTLLSNGPDGFKGFLCQTRKNLDTYHTYGALESDGDIPLTNNCDQSGSITHTEPSVKFSVRFVWRAPPFDTGDVYLVCTIVKEFGVFWTNVTSAKLLFSDRSSTSPTTVKSTASSTSATVTQGSTANTSTSASTYNATVTQTSTANITTVSNVSSTSDSAVTTSAPVISTSTPECLDAVFDNDNDDLCNSSGNVRSSCISFVPVVLAWLSRRC